MSARSCWIRYPTPRPQPPPSHRRSSLRPEVPGGLALRQSHLALQSLDLAEYSFLFALSFTTPTFDSEGAPSFGTLLATVNVALNMLGEVSWVLSDPSPQAFLPAFHRLTTTLGLCTT